MKSTQTEKYNIKLQSKVILSLILLSFLFFWTNPTKAHHYKGLPHYSYFENYPQIPYLEFIEEQKGYEIFTTVYNFQGLNLEQVSEPDQVRLYSFIYEIDTEKIYKGDVNFKIFSRGQQIHETGPLAPEQENIYVIQHPIKNQDNLILAMSFKNSDNQDVLISMPFQITKTFWQKYGLYVAISLFFIFVGILKKLSVKKNWGQTQNE